MLLPRQDCEVPLAVVAVVAVFVMGVVQRYTGGLLPRELPPSQSGRPGLGAERDCPVVFGVAAAEGNAQGLLVFPRTVRVDLLLFLRVKLLPLMVPNHFPVKSVVAQVLGKLLSPSAGHVREGICPASEPSNGPGALLSALPFLLSPRAARHLRDRPHGAGVGGLAHTDPCAGPGRRRPRYGNLSALFLYAFCRFFIIGWPRNPLFFFGWPWIMDPPLFFLFF